MSTRLVQINVIVENHGQPVAGLHREDFALYDQGQPQQIAFFSEQSAIGSPAVTTAPAFPPNTFSNRLDSNSRPASSATVILLDAVNTHYQDMSFARAQIVKFLEALQPQDRVALYGFSGRLYVLHDFTSDASALIRALDRYRATESFALAASEPETSDTGNDTIDNFLNSVNQDAADFFNMTRAQSTAEVLETIANHLSGLPGRKNLVWVSETFPIQIGFDAPLVPNDSVPASDNHAARKTFSAELERAAQALNDADIAVYPIDARGLIGNADPRMDASNVNPSTKTLRRPPPVQINPNRDNFTTMDTLAARTGGRAFYNTNDLKTAVRRAIDDSRDTYALGYYPTNAQWDGKFREVKVELTRTDGQLRYRRGYVATRNGPQDSASAREQIAAAARERLESTELGLTLHVDPEIANEVPRIKTRLKLDDAAMAFTQSGDHWLDKVDLVWVQLDADGKTVASASQTVDLDLPDATYRQIHGRGLILNSSVDLNNRASTLHLVVRDHGTGAIGSLNVALKPLFAGLSPPSS